MVKTTHIGTVKNSKFTPKNPAFLKNSINRFEGKECEVIVQEVDSTRSTRQNAYLHGVVYKIINQDSPYSFTQIHEYCKAEFLQRQEGIAGTEYTKSTTKLSKKEFNKYAEEVRMWAYEAFNSSIPLPNECEY